MFASHSRFPNAPASQWRRYIPTLQMPKYTTNQPISEIRCLTVDILCILISEETYQCKSDRSKTGKTACTHKPTNNIPAHWRWNAGYLEQQFFMYKKRLETINPRTQYKLLITWCTSEEARADICFTFARSHFVPKNVSITYHCHWWNWKEQGERRAVEKKWALITSSKEIFGVREITIELCKTEKWETHIYGNYAAAIGVIFNIGEVKRFRHEQSCGNDSPVMNIYTQQ